MLRTLLITFVLLIGCQRQEAASRWEELRPGVEIDTTTMARCDAGQPCGWTRTTRDAGTEYVLHEVDCQRRRIRTLHYVCRVDDNGATEDSKGSWTVVVPESVEESIARRLCK